MGIRRISSFPLATLPSWPFQSASARVIGIGAVELVQCVCIHFASQLGVVGKSVIYFLKTHADVCIPPGVRESSLLLALLSFLKGHREALADVCLHLQGATPEDFSNLPPEQRRKRLQQKVDELNKEMQKEMDQRYSGSLGLTKKFKLTLMDWPPRGE